MKNLKKALALLVCLAMVFTTFAVVFAYDDISVVGNTTTINVGDSTEVWVSWTVNNNQFNGPDDNGLCSVSIGMDLPDGVAFTAAAGNVTAPDLLSISGFGDQSYVAGGVSVVWITTSTMDEFFTGTTTTVSAKLVLDSTATAGTIDIPLTGLQDKSLINYSWGEEADTDWTNSTAHIVIQAAAVPVDVPVYTYAEVGGESTSAIATLASKTSVAAADVSAYEATAVAGHTFSSWKYGANYASATAVTFPLTELTAGNNLYAVYTANSYPVTWTQPAEGGTISAVTANGSAIENGANVKYGSEIAVTLTPDTTNYWSGGALQVNGAASATTFTMGAEAAALTATFTAPGAASVTIYRSGTSSVLYTNTSLTSGDSFTISTAGITAPANMVLDGFYVGTDLTGTLYPATYSFDVVGDVNVYAKFSYEEYTIYFSATGATSGVPANITGVTAQSSYAQVKTANNIDDYTPVADNKTFLGWTETEGSSTEFIWGNSKVTGDKYLYAMWYTLESGTNIANVKINNIDTAATGTTYTYDGSIMGTTVPVIITLAGDSSKATIDVDGTAFTSGVASNLALNEGDNSFTVTITAEDNSTATYTLVINRAAASAYLSISVGNTTVSPSYADEVATIPVKVGNASVATTFWATTLVFDYDNTIFDFDADTDVAWNTALDFDATEQPVCNAIDNGDGTTTVYMAIVLDSAVDIAASAWLDLAELSFTLKANQDSGTYTDIEINEDSTYTPDFLVDEVAYGNLASYPYGRVTFVINNPTITSISFNSASDASGVAGGIEVTRETVYITEVVAVKDPTAIPVEYYTDGVDNFSFAYQWYRDDVAVEGQTGTSYALTSDDIGKKISVKITITDTDANKTGERTETVFATVYRRGDANLSGIVDNSDASYVNNLNNNVADPITGKEHLYNAHVDDPCKDSIRDAFDVSAIQQLRVKLITDAAFDALTK